MEGTIVVKCPTKKLWDKVYDKAINGGCKPFATEDTWDIYKEDSYMHIDPDKFLQFGSSSSKGNNVTTAAEYLNEGGKDVSELKSGDYVEITDIQDGEDYVGSKLRVTQVHDDSKISVTCATPEGSTWYFSHGTFKILTNKPTKTQTTKENNMNTNISNVFDKTKEALLVEKHLGNQIGTSFIDGLILADKKDDVLKEAKRLEKEAKDNRSAIS